MAHTTLVFALADRRAQGWGHVHGPVLVGSEFPARPLCEAMPLIPSKLKPVSGARHMGRKTAKCTFEIRDIFLASGLPENISATGLVVQMSRGPKLATTKEVELTPEVKASGGGLAFPSALNFVATLFSSKTGKATGYSDKRYRVTVLALKPNFGSSKRSLKELASADLNISEHTSANAYPLTLELDRRQHDGLPLTLQFTISARMAAAGDDDDDDDAQSTSTAMFDAGREIESEAPSETLKGEQDLEGFDESTPSTRAPHPLVTASANARAKAKAEAEAQAQREIEAEFGDAPATPAAADASANPFDRSPSALNPFGRELKPAPPARVASIDANPFGRTLGLSSLPPAQMPKAPGAATPRNVLAPPAPPPAGAVASNPFGDEGREVALPTRPSLDAAAASAFDDDEDAAVLSDDSDEANAPRAASEAIPARRAMGVPSSMAAPPAGGRISQREQMDLDELVQTREELSYVKEQLSRAQAEASSLREDGRSRAGEAEKGWTGAQREVSKLRQTLNAAESERDDALRRLKGIDAQRIAAQASADALKAQLSAASSSGSGKREDAESAANAAAQAAVAASSAEELAEARAEASRALRQAQAAETRASEAEEEVEVLQSQLAEQAEAAAGERKKNDDEHGQLSTLLIEAKRAHAPPP